MELNSRLIAALKEISQWKEYPPNWKTKSREKLEALGMVENIFADSPEAVPAYRLTEAGRKQLEALGQ